MLFPPLYEPHGVAFRYDGEMTIVISACYAPTTVLASYEPSVTIPCMAIGKV